MGLERNTLKMERNTKDSSRKIIDKTMEPITTSMETLILESGIKINAMGKELRDIRMGHIFRAFGKMTKSMGKVY